METWEEAKTQANRLTARQYGRCYELIGEIGVDANNQQHIIAACLYASIVELCGSALILVREDQFIGVPQIIRSMFEADVDLINVISDANYVCSLSAAHSANMIRVMQKAHDNDDETFIKVAGGSDEIRAFLKEKRKDLDKLKSEGFSPLQISERFERANRGQEYISAYAHLCGNAHNDLGTLEARHLRKSVDGKFTLVIFEEIGVRNEVHLIDLVSHVLIGASGRTHDFFETGHFEEIDQMLSELNDLRTKWPDDPDCS